MEREVLLHVYLQVLWVMKFCTKLELHTSLRAQDIGLRLTRIETCTSNTYVFKVCSLRYSTYFVLMLIYCGQLITLQIWHDIVKLVPLVFWYLPFTFFNVAVLEDDCLLECCAVMEAVRNSETSVSFYQCTLRNIPYDGHLHTRRRENMKSHVARLN
jgi:hypothetical protein